MTRMAAETPAGTPTIEYVALPCPIDGCGWSVSATQSYERPSAFVVVLCALEVLSHVVGRYGAEGRTPHTPEQIEAAGIYPIIAAAFPDHW